MIIRPALIEELPALSDLCLRSKGMWDYDPDFLEGCRAPLTIHPANLETDHVMVAETEARILGVVQLSISGEEAELDKLFIDPDATGMGVGGALLDWARDKARACGAKRMSLASDPFAQNFYQKHGAQKIGTVRSEVDPDRTLPHMQITL
nr:GNAT family N-acetyltransferase [uncultured Cohaesibacter sp.]